MQEAAIKNEQFQFSLSRLHNKVPLVSLMSKWEPQRMLTPAKVGLTHGAQTGSFGLIPWRFVSIYRGEAERVIHIHIAQSEMKRKEDAKEELYLLQSKKKNSCGHCNEYRKFSMQFGLRKKKSSCRSKRVTQVNHNPTRCSSDQVYLTCDLPI